MKNKILSLLIIFFFGVNSSYAQNSNKLYDKIDLFSEVLNKPVKFRVSSSALRTVEKKGGIDKFLSDAFEKDLSDSAVYYKKLIKRKEATKA